MYSWAYKQFRICTIQVKYFEKCLVKKILQKANKVVQNVELSHSILPQVRSRLGLLRIGRLRIKKNLGLLQTEPTLRRCRVGLLQVEVFL